MMTLAACIARWKARRDQYARVDAHVAAATLVTHILRDLARVAVDPPGDLLKLTQAGAVSGYTADHLGRLVRQGRLTNYGRPNAPRVRRADLPRKLPPPSVPLRAPAVGTELVGASRRQIASQSLLHTARLT